MRKKQLTRARPRSLPSGVSTTTNALDPGPSEAHVYADSEAALDCLVRRTSPHHLILWGRSLGSAPTIHLARLLLARGVPLAGVVLQSPLVSVLRVGLSASLWTALVDPASDIFPNLARVRDGGLGCPVFVIHGQADYIVSCAHGEELYESVPDEHKFPPLFVAGAGHNDVDEVLGRQGSSILFHVRKFVNFCCTQADPALPPVRDVYVLSAADAPTQV